MQELRWRAPPVVEGSKDVAKRALVIGIGHYEQHDKLLAAPDMARQLADLLEDHGAWTVERVIVDDIDGPTGRCQELGLCIRDFFERTLGRDDILFYYCGHSETDAKGGLHLGGVDSGGVGGRLNSSISFADLRDLWQNTAATSKTMMLDCCRAGSFPKFVADDLREGLSLFLGTFEGQAAVAGPDCTLFSKYLIDGLNAHPGTARTPAELVAYLSAEYPEELKKHQSPTWLQHGWAPTLVLKPKAAPPPPGAASIPVTSRSGDVEAKAEPDGLRITWKASTGKSFSWPRLVGIEAGERPLAIAGARDHTSVSVVLVGGGKTRVIRSKKSGGLQILHTAQWEAGTATFGTGLNLGKVFVGAEEIDLTKLGDAPDEGGQ